MTAAAKAPKTLRIAIDPRGIGTCPVTHMMTIITGFHPDADSEYQVVPVGVSCSPPQAETPMAMRGHATHRAGVQ